MYTFKSSFIVKQTALRDFARVSLDIVIHNGYTKNIFPVCFKKLDAKKMDVPIIYAFILCLNFCLCVLYLQERGL